jgi:DNA-binding transcriptional MocR family regulator
MPLYIELKRRFNGHKNGHIYLRHRDAADALAVHRNTVGPWFSELEERGFIVMTKGPHLGSHGTGISAQKAFTYVAMPSLKRAETISRNGKAPHKNSA